MRSSNEGLSEYGRFLVGAPEDLLFPACILHPHGLPIPHPPLPLPRIFHVAVHAAEFVCRASARGSVQYIADSTPSGHTHKTSGAGGAGGIGRERGRGTGQGTGRGRGRGRDRGRGWRRATTTLTSRRRRRAITTRTGEGKLKPDPKPLGI